MSTNPSAVTRILKNAGYRVSKTQPSRIKHFREHTPGFCSELNAKGTVDVYFRMSSLVRSNKDTVRENLEIAEPILEAKGYAVEHRGWDIYPHLRVEKIS